MGEEAACASADNLGVIQQNSARGVGDDARLVAVVLAGTGPKVELAPGIFGPASNREFDVVEGNILDAVRLIAPSRGHEAEMV